MPERRFETELERQFDAAPAFGDTDLFALRVSERLARGWSLRRLWLGGLGGLGGLIGGGQILQSGLAGRLGALGAQSSRLLTEQFHRLASADFLPAELGVGPEVLWTSAALAILAIGFAIARVIREI